MMKKHYTLPLFLLTLTSCADNAHELNVIDPQTNNYESGVVIAQSEFKGRKYDGGLNGMASDCVDEEGVGVVVKSTLRDSSYMFDAVSNPCKKADIVFDGSLDKFARTADPAIDITFTDKYGPLSKLNNIEKTSKNATVLADSSAGNTIYADLANGDFEQMGLLAVDYEPAKEAKHENAAQETFNALVKDSLALEKEQELADQRAIFRAKEEKLDKEFVYQNALSKQAILYNKREKEEALAQLDLKNKELLELEAQINTLKNTKESQEINYKEKLALLEDRVEEYAKLSLALKRENERLALSAISANKSIDTGLKAAENDADAARYAAMLTMANDIKVDETLSKALAESQKKALYRKADRLQKQADNLAYHADSDKVFNKDMDKIYQELQNNFQPAFKGKIARVEGVPLNGTPNFTNVKLLLKENDKSVNELLLEILSDVQPVMGTWRVDWKLKSQNLEIKDEKWNVSAETTLYEFLQYMVDKVKEIHGVDITVTPYEESMSIVITDEF